jgi:hypothetical protein
VYKPWRKCVHTSGFSVLGRVLVRFCFGFCLGSLCSAQLAAGRSGPHQRRAFRAEPKHIEARGGAGTMWRVFQPVCNGAIAWHAPRRERGDGRAAGWAVATRGRAGRGRQHRRAHGELCTPSHRKVFDNLYFLGMYRVLGWAITTSQGIILLDAIYDYSIEAEVDEGLRKLGLNPADIKYVIVSHGHLDHAGGAKFLQEKYGARSSCRPRTTTCSSSRTRRGSRSATWWPPTA